MMKLASLLLLFACMQMPALAAVQESESPATETQTESPTEESELTQEQKDYFAWAQELWGSMNQVTGEVALPGGIATLNVPENFYYLSPEDSKKVLTDVWGNPPSLGENVLGMLFPAEVTPFDGESWGVTIEYTEDGYIPDEDADTIDYAEMLTQMQEDTAEENKARAQQGYEAIELIGWAAQPYYDADTNKLHWAKELRFGESESNTLNYNIRVLGRKGVLVLNFIAGMNQLEIINNNLPSVLEIAQFNPGYRYDEFNPDVDDVAAYGIGALVAGKVLAKTGFIAVALMFLKKFWVFIAVGLFALGRSLFKRKKEAVAE